MKPQATKMLLGVVMAGMCGLSMASSLCDRQPTKAKSDQCYSSLIAERTDALEELHEAVLSSTHIPVQVKQKIDVEYRSFMRNIGQYCPDKSCIALAMMVHMESIYEQIRRYTVPHD